MASSESNSFVSPRVWVCVEFGVGFADFWVLVFAVNGEVDVAVFWVMETMEHGAENTEALF